jgi:hypothetical protein
MERINGPFEDDAQYDNFDWFLINFERKNYQLII